MAGSRRKLHNKELPDFCSSSDSIKSNHTGKFRWVGHVTRVGGEQQWIEVVEVTA